MHNSFIAPLGVLLAIIAIIASSPTTTSFAAAQSTFADSPAFAFDNVVNRDDTTAFAGPISVGVSGYTSYIMGSGKDYTNDTTIACVFDAFLNGSCVKEIQRFPGTTTSISLIDRADFHDNFFFTALNYDDLSSTTYRWSPYEGMQWAMNRGIIPAHNTETADYYNEQITMVKAVSDGSTDLIVAVATHEGHLAPSWSQAIPVVPKTSIKANTAHARDFGWTYDDGVIITFITLGRVYALNGKTGDVVDHLDTPCGFSGAGLRLAVVSVDYQDKLVVHGNSPDPAKPGQNRFVVCVLNMSGTLNVEWNYTHPTAIQLADGDQGVMALTTNYVRARIPFRVRTLYISGTENTTTGNPFKLWLLDMDSGALRFTLERQYSDIYNMPIKMDEKDNEHIAITLNGVLQGLNPGTNEVQWTCAGLNEGFQATPGSARAASGALGRLTGISASNPSRVISVDVGNHTAQCTLAWVQVVPDVFEIAQQPVASEANWNKPPYLEPFVAFPTKSGRIWTLAVRAASEPGPRPPTPPPTPAPTPVVYPQPKYHLTNAPITPGITLGAVPIVSPFGTSTQSLVGTGLVNDYDQQKKRQMINKMTKLKGGEKAPALPDVFTYNTYFYYQTINLADDFAPIPQNYFELRLSYTLFIDGPVLVYSKAGTDQFVGAATLDNDSPEDAIYILRTVKDSATGTVEKYYRHGASTMPAGDGSGLLFFTTGVDNGTNYETLYAFEQVGLASKSAVKWQVQYPAPAGVPAYSTHTSDILYTTARDGTGLVALSHLNELVIYNAQTGKPAVAAMTAPCTYASSPSPYDLYYPMDLFAAKAGTVDYIMAVVDLRSSLTANTLGVCALDVTSATSISSTYGFVLHNVSWVTNVIALPGQDMYILDVADDMYYNQIIARDFATGKLKWSAVRTNAPGFLIAEIPGTNQLLTDMDDPKDIYNMYFAVVDATSGKILGACDFACQYFSLVQNSNKQYVAICNDFKFDSIVRAVRFDKNFKCVIDWEVDVGASVHGIAPSLYTVDSKPYVSIVTSTGYVYSASPDAGSKPTFAPGPTANPFPLPAASNVAPVPAQFIKPIATAPTTTVLSYNGAGGSYFGSVSFVGITAQTTVSSSSSSSSSFTAAAADDEKNENEKKDVGAASRHTVILGYQAEQNGAAFGPIMYEFNDANTQPYPATIIASTSAYVAAAFTTKRPSWGELVVIAYPVKRFEITRFGAYSISATDGAGSVFFSSGALQNMEFFSRFALDSTGKEFTEKWIHPLTPPNHAVVANLTSHTGNPVYIQTDSGAGLVSFSYFDTLFTLHADTGKQAQAWQNPCGFVSPQDPEFGAPVPMVVTYVAYKDSTKASGFHGRTVTLVDAQVSHGKGSWGACGFAPTSKTQSWNRIITNVLRFNAMTTFSKLNSPWLMIDITTTAETGYMWGINAQTGAYWSTGRKLAVTRTPVGMPPDASYFVSNWDKEDGSAYTMAMLVTATGKVESRCDFACWQTPGAGEGPNGEYLFFCSMLTDPTVVRAFYFDPKKNNKCTVYWEQIYAEYVESVTASSTVGEMALGLYSGATAVVSVRSQNDATPSPAASPKSGMSGGVVAAIVILVLLAVAVAAGGVYLVHRRSVRRSAMTETNTGLQYTTDDNSGYGAIT